MARGFGPYLTDVDGNEYVDLVCSWGPLILGHAHPAVVDAVTAAVARDVVRHAHRRRGRAGRGDRGAHPGRPGPAGVIRHRGHHVGHPAGPRIHRPRPRGEVRRLLPRPRRLAARFRRVGAGDLRHPGTPGVPAASTAATLVLRTTTSPRSSEAFAEHGDRDRLRDHRGRCRQHGCGPAESTASTPGSPELCREHGALFISDEVMTGFRVGRVRLLGHRRRGRGLAARPDDLRQGDGRRLPGRCVRRPRRRDGPARADRARSTRPARCRGTRSPPPPG